MSKSYTRFDLDYSKKDKVNWLKISALEKELKREEVNFARSQVIINCWVRTYIVYREVEKEIKACEVFQRIAGDLDLPYELYEELLEER